MCVGGCTIVSSTPVGLAGMGMVSEKLAGMGWDWGEWIPCAQGMGGMD